MTAGPDDDRDAKLVADYIAGDPRLGQFVGSLPVPEAAEYVRSRMLRAFAGRAPREQWQELAYLQHLAFKAARRRGQRMHVVDENGDSDY